MTVRLLTLASCLAATPGLAQAQTGHDHSQMGHAPTPDTPPAAPPAVEHDHMGEAEPEAPATTPMPMNHDHHAMMPAEAPEPMTHAAHGGAAPAFSTGSGTSRLPGAGDGMTGLHVMTGPWMLMAHGYVTANYTDHKGPRGDDLAYSTSMLMLTGERDLGGARLQLRSMMSLEPTMSARGYPNLFGTGETANGQPLVDRQHPHDLFMELAARLDVAVAPGASLFLYGGAVGEPALGPSAFMMRGSARYNPEPPISHHWFDATHITYGVVTAGLSTPQWQIEGSAFRGREPDEARWDIETPRLDSWSVRLSWSPTPNWSAQVSHGFLKQPEALHAGENEHRTTASVHYGNDSGLSAMAAFSAKDRDPGGTLTGWLAEATYDLAEHHSLFARVENVANDELAPDHHDPLHDKPFRVTKAQAGYAWNTKLGKGPLHLALGGSISLYGKPQALDALYGANPWGYTLFARLSLGR